MSDAFSTAVSTGCLPIDILLAALWSAGASVCCAVYLNTPRKDLPIGGFLGALGWVLYLSIKGLTASLFGAYFIGAFAMALGSEIFAFLLKKPATIYILPGFLPLVPGGGMFKTMQAMIQGTLTHAALLGYETVGSAVAIALGIAIASSFARIIRKLLKIKRVKTSIKRSLH